MGFTEELHKRRTFGIISHPDAGKTTLTEKLLLFGGAIQVAGAVKSNKIKRSATSDFMEIERQRGISVATSVMAFEYRGLKINILDTPGHQDFQEDTYRTLTAVDSVIVVIDVAKGVETQTEKLVKVCRRRKTPIIVFINKLDREGKDGFDLLDEVEQKLGLMVRPLSWPIGMGQRFQGVYNLYEKKLVLFRPHGKQSEEDLVEFNDLDNEELDNYVGESAADELREEVHMIEEVYPEFVHTNEQGMKSVNYAQMNAVLIEAIKELNTKVERLENENASLKASMTEVQTLREQMDKLLKELGSSKAASK